jgi:tetratricopeptide (TPR) repeat protein
MAKKMPFTELLDLAPEADERLSFLGEAGYLWMYLQDYDKAAQVFDGLALVAPNDPVGHLGLAEVYLRQGKYKQADKAASQAVRRKNVSPQTMAYSHVILGQALAAQEKREEAIKVWEKAAELDPNANEAVMARSWIEAVRAVGKLSEEQGQKAESPGSTG